MVEGAQKEAGAWVAHAEGKDDEAVKTLRPIAEDEESTGDEPEDIPAREMLADLLLETNHPDQALAEYEADLKFNPNRFNGLYGAASAAEAAGKNEKATTYYAQLVKVCAGSNSDRRNSGGQRRWWQVSRLRPRLCGETGLCHHSSLATKTAIIATEPSAALYSRCFQYKSQENAPLFLPAGRCSRKQPGHFLSGILFELREALRAGILLRRESPADKSQRREE